MARRSITARWLARMARRFLYMMRSHRSAREFEKAGPALSGTELHSEVALLYSYDSRWAINWQRHNQAFDPKDALISYYGPLRRWCTVWTLSRLQRRWASTSWWLRPALNVMTDAQANNLMEYVRGGGHLVLGQRSAMKNDDNGLQPERQPGPLTGMLGGRVEQFYALNQDVPVTGDWGSGSGKYGPSS